MSVDIYLIEIGDCWHWVGAVDARGYGRTRYRGRTWLAHRAAWDALVGPIADGMTIDHLCRNRSCVNPDHLQVVTLAENLSRGYSVVARVQAYRNRQTCKYGHPWEHGRRRCRECNRLQNIRYRQRKAAQR